MASSEFTTCFTTAIHLGNTAAVDGDAVAAAACAGAAANVAVCAGNIASGAAAATKESGGGKGSAAGCRWREDSVDISSAAARTPGERQAGVISAACDAAAGVAAAAIALAG
eukprot:1160468-Pelagomonas_calceolata.AAC.6